MSAAGRLSCIHAERMLYVHTTHGSTFLREMTSQPPYDVTHFTVFFGFYFFCALETFWLTSL